MYKIYHIFFAISFLFLGESMVLAEEETQWNVTLRADSDSTSKLWVQPANFSYAVNTKGRDSFSAAIAATVGRIFVNEWEVNSKVKWVRNNQQNKEQNYLQFGLGVSKDISAAGLPDPKKWAFRIDTNISYNKESVFADLSKPLCIAEPSLPLCQTQSKEALRLTAQMSPFKGKWMESDIGGAVYYTGVPVFGVFYDEVINNPINPETGNRITGSVLGGYVGAGAAFSPLYDNFKWIFRLEGKVIQRFSAVVDRKEDFGLTTAYFSASLDYSLSGGGLDDFEGGIFLPSIGIQYKEGQDPLSGRKKQSTVIVGLRLQY